MLCQDTIEQRVANLEGFSRRHRLPLPKQEELGQRVYADTLKVIAILAKDQGMGADYTCIVRNSGAVHCTKVSALLAFYTAPMAEAILRDLGLLYARLGFDPADNTAFSCDDGFWGSTKATGESGGGSSTGFDLTSVFAQADLDKMVAVCRTWLLSGGGAPGRVPGGGFSGITGIDPLGSLCAFGLGRSSLGFADHAMDTIKNHEKGCGAWSVIESVTEGAGDPPKQPDPPKEPEPKDPKPTIAPAPDAKVTKVEPTLKDNGDGTTSLTEKTTYSDRTVVYKKETWKNDTGETVSTEQEVVRVLSDSKFGTITQGEYTKTDANGNLVTSAVWTKNEEGWTRIIRTDYTQSPPKTDERLVSPTGTVYSDPKVVCIGGSCDTVWQKKTPRGDCIDEDCSTCAMHALNMAAMLQKCGSGAHLSHDCLGSTEAESCCQNPKVFKADPRLVLPNPEGDLLCTGRMDASSEEPACKERCRLAASETDCLRTCLSTPRDGVKGNFMTMKAYCVYAISEECFKGEAPSAPVPPVENPWRPSPLPAPHMLPFMLLPMSDQDVRDLGRP